MKHLILYFSHSGHTRRIAELLQQELGGDLLAIEPLQDYPANYLACLWRSGYELVAKKMPALQPLPFCLEDYDAIILGSPVWWFTCPPVLRNCLAALDIPGLSIYPFFTCGGNAGKAEKYLQQHITQAHLQPAYIATFTGDGHCNDGTKFHDWLYELRHKLAVPIPYADNINR